MTKIVLAVIGGGIVGGAVVFWVVAKGAQDAVGNAFGWK